MEPTGKFMFLQTEMALEPPVTVPTRRQVNLDLILCGSQNWLELEM